MVHAASLENQFVADGYSFEQYGRALFTNDFVLGGPNADPAGVMASGKNDIARAFADVASAGVNGGGTPKATFVSRGGTPGTTVSEHGIWQLVSSSGLSPAGLLLCTVSAANGGGETPIATGQGVTGSGQACPGSGALAGLPSHGGGVQRWQQRRGRDASRPISELSSRVCEDDSRVAVQVDFLAREVVEGASGCGLVPPAPPLQVLDRRGAEASQPTAGEIALGLGHVDRR